MRTMKTTSGAQSRPPRAARYRWDLVGRAGSGGLLVIALLVGLAAATQAAPPESPRETVVKLVAQIQKSDYEGDRAVLQRLYADLEPFTGDEKLKSFWDAEFIEC